MSFNQTAKLSVVIPMRKERGNAASLIQEIDTVLAEKLMDLIGAVENVLGRTAEKHFFSMQSGDVQATYADASNIEHWTGFKPTTRLEQGIGRFVQWDLDYYSKTTG